MRSVSYTRVFYGQSGISHVVNMSLLCAMHRNTMAARMNASGNAADSMRNASLLNADDVWESDVEAETTERGEPFAALCLPSSLRL